MLRCKGIIPTLISTNKRNNNNNAMMCVLSIKLSIRIVQTLASLELCYFMNQMQEEKQLNDYQQPESDLIHANASNHFRIKIEMIPSLCLTMTHVCWTTNLFQ